MKKFIKYVFIYVMFILLTGCHNSIVGLDCSNDCYLDISIPLENHIPVVTIDENDFYRVEYDDEMGVGINYISVNAETGHNGYTRVNWMTDTEIPMGQYGEMVDVINGSSYSDENGFATTILGVWDIMVNDSITVYSGYIDDCGEEQFDLIKIIIDDEI